jgi:aminoglycoside phosphotransferase (APT) family kinase protein
MAATSTWLWFVDLTGVNLPVPWQRPLVLRIFRPGEGSIAEREDRLSTFLTTKRYPVPATHLRGEIGAPPHPFVLQSRLPGRPAMEMLAGPHGRGVVARLGRLQGQLHRMSTTNFPLRRFNAAVYVEHELASRRAIIAGTDSDDWLSWLRSTAARFEARSEHDVVVCHGDLHPLNAVANVENGLHLGVVDWTDACIADRHLDVGRTISLYWFAAAVQPTTYRRRAVRLLRSSMVQLHLRSYRRAARVRLDVERLLWWQIVHLYRTWLQLQAVAEHAVSGPTNTVAQHVSPKLPDELLDRCVVLRTQIERRRGGR